MWLKNISNCINHKETPITTEKTLSVLFHCYGRFVCPKFDMPIKDEVFHLRISAEISTDILALEKDLMSLAVLKKARKYGQSKLTWHRHLLTNPTFAASIPTWT